jgi:peptidoglycan/LPS O-acetylase OafA/YrhL
VSSAARFTVVDGLRGIAAFSVVLFHAVGAGQVDLFFASLPSWTRQVLLLGQNGVAIFFALSGFVIAHSLFDREMTGSELGRFTVRRSLRLDPPYWASIIVAILFAYLSSRVVSGKEFPVYTLPQISAHLVYLQDILGFRSIESVYWTLCLEIQFYIIYGLMVIAGAWKQVLISAACVVSSLWPLHFAPMIFPGLFLSLWHTFLLGVAAYWAWTQPKAAPIFCFFAVVMLGAGWTYNAQFTIVAALTSLLLYLCAVSGTLYRGLNWRWLQFLGLISYSLYLTHSVVTGAVFRIGRMVTPPGPIMELVWWTVSIAASVVAAAIFWLVVERPSLRLSKWIGARPAMQEKRVAAQTPIPEQSAPT